MRHTQAIANSSSWLRGAAALLVAVACAVVYAFDPAGSAWYPKCTLHLLTGWHCPGCGATRAVHAILHADLRGAVAQNALVVGAIPLALAFGVAELFAKRRALAAWSTRLRPAWIWTALAIAMAFGIARNIPIPPFDLLAPH